MTCPGRDHQGRPCELPPGPSGFCTRHDPDAARERGRRGGQAKASAARAARAATAAALRAETLADLRTALTAALRQAYTDGDMACVVSAVRAGIELHKAGDLEKTVAELRELVETHVRRGPLGVVR